MIDTAAVKHYKIGQLKDFYEVPDHKLDECLEDFKSWIQAMRDAEKLFKMLPWYLRFIMKYIVRVDFNGFHWIDDGIRGGNMSFKLNVEDCEED